MANPNPRNRPWRFSTGPRTPEGKRRSSQNHVSTGLYTRPVRRLVELEDRFRRSRTLENFEAVEEARVAAVSHVFKVANLRDDTVKLKVMKYAQLQTRRSISNRRIMEKQLGG